MGIGIDAIEESDWRRKRADSFYNFLRIEEEGMEPEKLAEIKAALGCYIEGGPEPAGMSEWAAQECEEKDWHKTQ